MYENAFNSIERALRAEEGIANELDYVEQTSWVLFLKYLHDLETERKDRAELEGKNHTPIIEGEFRWDRWAAPKKDGEFDHNAARIGDDLVAFVDQKLFPYLASFHQKAEGPKTIHYKIGEVFTELRNKFRSGYILRDVLEVIDSLSFNTQAQRHELSELYETRIRRMGNAGRNAPHPLYDRVQADHRQGNADIRGQGLLHHLGLREGSPELRRSRVGWTSPTTRGRASSAPHRAS